MAVPKLYINSTEVYFTIRDSYDVEINPSNGKRKWKFDIYGGPNIFHSAQYQPIIDEILTASQAGTLTFTEADSETPVSVKVSGNISVTGIMRGLPIITVSVEEPGFSDDSGLDTASINDVTIYGNFGGVYFEGKLSDYSESIVLVGELQRAITGKIIPSQTALQYLVSSLSIPNWHNKPMPKIGERWRFTLSYRDKATDTVFIRRGGGRIVNSPNLNGMTLMVEIQENLGEYDEWTADNADGTEIEINGGGWSWTMGFESMEPHYADDVTDGVV
jgi:hypothetical protein